MLFKLSNNASAKAEITPSSIASASNATELSPDQGSLQRLVLDEATTISFAAAWDGTQFNQICLIVENASTYSVTWPAVFASAPSIADDNPHVFEFHRAPGGSWVGLQVS